VLRGNADFSWDRERLARRFCGQDARAPGMVQSKGEIEAFNEIGVSLNETVFHRKTQHGFFVFVPQLDVHHIGIQTVDPV